MGTYFSNNILLFRLETVGDVPNTQNLSTLGNSSLSWQILVYKVSIGLCLIRFLNRAETIRYRGISSPYEGTLGYEWISNYTTPAVPHLIPQWPQVHLFSASHGSLFGDYGLLMRENGFWTKTGRRTLHFQTPHHQTVSIRWNRQLCLYPPSLNSFSTDLIRFS